MSTPEWMKKFQEIGQKGEEEVTALGNDGFVKTAEPRRSIELAETSNMQGSISGSDAGAIFHGAAASGPRGVSSKSYHSQDPPGDSSSVVVSSDDSSSEGVSSDGISSGDVNTNPSYDDASDGESGEESSEIPTSTTTKDEDFGDSWVVDQDKIKSRGSDVDSQAAADADRQSFNPAESFITEEVFVDEDGNEVDENGNEILMDENDGEIQDESDDEIEVDESDDEVQVVSDDEMQVDENGDEIQEDDILVDESDMDLAPHPEQDPNRDVHGIVPGKNNQTAYATDKYGEGERSTLPSGAAYDIEEQRRILRVGKPGNRSRMSWCIPILVFAIIIASILVVIFFVVYNEDRELFGITTTMAPTPTNYLKMDPTASSSGSIYAAATTEFDTIQNDCSFNLLGLVQPNIVDQCNCDGTVDILADDVRARWKDLAQNFIPTIVDLQWNEPTNSCSPENQALLWLSSGINNGGEIDNLYILQRYVLALIYYQHGGTGWRRSTDWLSEKNVCEWEGVECDKNLYIRILNLDQNLLTGQLSGAPTLLNAIEAYFVSNNNLTGSIPDAYVSDNSLRYIDFSGNALSGEFPSDISKENKLARINFGSNNLIGSVPSQISEITGLEVINIESNTFSGSLPSSLFTLQLTELSIGGNEFTGTIPGELSDVSTLTSISLGPNMFNGELPTSLRELTALKQLSIVGIPDLNGRLPASYGIYLTDLAEFSISDTNVEGDVPDLYSKMTGLETLRLSNNSIRGTIPSSLSLLMNLKNLSFNENDLTGTIPSELGLLSSLQELQFHANNFSGTVPDEFRNLLKIRTLTFDNNFLNGRVPDGVCALRDAELNKFIVDCPTLAGESRVNGIICSVPDCCTKCL